MGRSYKFGAGKAAEVRGTGPRIVGATTSGRWLECRLQATLPHFYQQASSLSLFPYCHVRTAVTFLACFPLSVLSFLSSTRPDPRVRAWNQCTLSPPDSTHRGRAGYPLVICNFPPIFTGVLACCFRRVRRTECSLRGRSGVKSIIRIGWGALTGM